MRAAAWALLMLSAGRDGHGDGPEQAAKPAGAARSSLPAAVAASGASNPLIGVWARAGGSGCRAEMIEFTAARISWQPPGAGAAMATTPVRYDLSDPARPVATPQGAPSFAFRIVDADHLSEGGSCLLARAD